MIPVPLALLAIRSMEDALKLVREKKQLFSHIRTAADMPVMPNKAGAGWGWPGMGQGHPWDGGKGRDLVMVLGGFRFG